MSTTVSTSAVPLFKSLQFETLAIDVMGEVARIAMNRPEKHNAINELMMHELQSAFRLADRDGSIHVVILRGAGDKTFSAGIDLRDDIMDKADKVSESMLRTLLPLLESMERSTKLIIGSIGGPAIGLGCALALHCDLIVMADTASMNLTFGKLGLVADGGINWILQKKVGYHRALQMVVDAEVLGAPRCLELGIANKLVPHETLEQEVLAWAGALARQSTVQQGFSKQLMRRALNGASLLESVRNEAELQALCAETDYFRNARAKFLAR